ncbi:MAG: hypothetical protein Q9200_002884 [Gallowayella weberi]
MLLSRCAEVQDNFLRLPPTPPDFHDGLDTEADDDMIQSATHVIATERDALTNLHNIYHSDPVAQKSFKQAVNVVSKTSRQGGRIIVSGVGKSGKIGQKFVATLNSFGIRSASLHPTEAMHGDMGMIGQHDSIVILTYSGHTPEIISLLPYLPSELPLIAITSHADASSCPLFVGRSSLLCALLPAPIPCSENEAFGVPSPMSSTTTALALTDALALASARRLHPCPSAIFHRYHPGGAIGARVTPTDPPLMASIAIMIKEVPIVVAQQAQTRPTILDVILTAASSASGWVRMSPEAIISPRQIQRVGRRLDLGQTLDIEDDTVVEKGNWISISAASSVQEAQAWILQMRQTRRGRTFLKKGTVLGIVDAQQCVSGVVEIEEIIDDSQLRDSG